jgi:PKD repeat protein
MKSLDIDWGDGGPIQSLGAVTGTQAVSHTYSAARTYTITATATDVAGGSAKVSTTVAVIQAPPPTINISYSPVPAKAGTQVIITVQITAPQGLSIVNSTITFGDGTSAGLGGGSTSAQPHVYTAAGTYTVTVTVTDTSGQTTTGFTSVSVGT